MPIVGFKCIKTHENVSFDKCISCALTYENKCHYTAGILHGIREQIREPRDVISVTRLIGCPRGTYLLNKNDVYVSPEKLYWAFRGTLAHTVLQKYNIDEDAILEKRFNRTIKGIKISGQPDLIVPKHKLLIDYKTSKEVPFFNKVYSNHEIQLNIYRWLISKHYKIDRLEVVYMDMGRVKTIPVKNIWKLADCEDYVLKHATVIAEAFKTNIPPKVPSEFPLYWQCRDYCECNRVCAKIYKDELRVDFDKWAETEWCKDE